MNIKEIKDYIIQNYWGGGIKWENVTTDEDAIDKCIDFFYHSRLDIDSKHDTVIVKNCLRKYLSAIGKEVPSERSAMLQVGIGVRDVIENEILLSLAYTLDTLGITEHSNWIGSARLTKEGEILLWLLNHDKDIGIYLRGLYNNNDSSANSK